MKRIRGFPRSAIKYHAPAVKHYTTLLKSKVEIYIPVNNDKQIEVARDTMRSFCKEYGGATTIKAMGSWIMKDGFLALDDIAIIYSFVPRITPQIKKFVRLEAMRVREFLEEEAITIVLNGVVEFI